MLLTVQAGFEPLLAREVAAVGARAVETGAGWLRVEPGGSWPEPAAMDWCFAHRGLIAPVELRGTSVNALAGALLEWFAGSLRGERVEQPWSCVIAAPAEVPGLARRLASVEEEFLRGLRRRLARVARLASPALPRGTGPARGLFVWATDFGRLFASREAWLGGQRRMADDPAAPSRSYLKAEEAYALLGREPAPGETVVDLGAAPGGWSYGAAKRGAQVIAVDNGPLKAGAADHPRIEHRREDAFRFRLAGRVDWLLCDLVEEPHRVWREILLPWCEHGGCRRFVVNLKFGRTDPLPLLDEVRRSSSSPLRCARPGLVRHLFHDREEFTLVGELPDAC